MEKRIRSSQIVILTAVSCLLLALVITSPVIFTGVESKNGDPAVQASILAERHLDSAMDEMLRTGICSAEGRSVSCSDSSGSLYELDTRVVRGSSGEVDRVSVRVKWKGPLGGGAIVATGLFAETADHGQTTLSAGAAGNGSAPSDVLTADR